MIYVDIALRVLTSNKVGKEGEEVYHGLDSLPSMMVYDCPLSASHFRPVSAPVPDGLRAGAGHRVRE